MSIQDLIERVASLYSIEEVLYILNKDEEWLLNRIKDELIENKKEIIYGVVFYKRIY